MLLTTVCTARMPHKILELRLLVTQGGKLQKQLLLNPNPPHPSVVLLNTEMLNFSLIGYMHRYPVTVWTNPYGANNPEKVWKILGWCRQPQDQPRMSKLQSVLG